METLFALYIIVKSVGIYTEIQILKEFTAHTAQAHVEEVKK